jgi:hypothetical protein
MVYRILGALGWVRLHFGQLGSVTVFVTIGNHRVSQSLVHTFLEEHGALRTFRY